MLTHSNPPSLARRAVALKPVDIDAHNALAAALAGPDASNDWRGRGSGERAEEAMHHFCRGLQLEAAHSKYSRSTYSLSRAAVPQGLCLERLQP